MSKNHLESPEQRLVRPLLWSVLAAAAVYGASAIVTDFRAVSTSMAMLGFVGWTIVLSLSLVNYGLRFVRWEIYLGCLNCRVPRFLSLLYYVGGFAFTTTPGKAGEAVRSLYLKRHGVAYTHSLAAFFSERFVDLIAMVLLALIAVLGFPEFQWLVLVILVLVLIFLPLIHVKSFHTFLDRQRDKLSSERLQSIASRLLDLMRSATVLLKSGPLYSGLALALLAWGAEGVAFHVILDALGVHISVGLAVGIYSISVLTGALTFIPGGLGSTEAVMVWLLTLVGADTPTAIAATMICRLATLWFAVVIGGTVLGILELNSRNGQRPSTRPKVEL
jgi:uncharacterized protein (TIRG00374 family)